MRIRAPFLLLIWAAISPAAIAQLSEGEGQVVQIPNTRVETYLPKYFHLKEGTTPGVMHRESGTFVIVVEVPAGENITIQEGLSEEFFEDPSLIVLDVEEQGAQEVLNRDGRLYLTKYQLQGYDFERWTLLFEKHQKLYLLIGNYTVKLKDQVLEEVISVMQNTIIK